MSTVTFKQVQIENFLGLKSGELNLDNQGLVLIRGENDDSSANSNGSGKSSVVDAISWALYGVTARGVSGDAVVNRAAGKNCRVQVELELDGEVIHVRRHRKHKAGKNRLEVFNVTTSIDLTLGTDKQTQELVEKMIGASIDVFQASIYAGQERMPDLPGMTDKELKQLVEQAAGAVVLDAAHGIASERLREAKSVRREAELALSMQINSTAAARERLDRDRLKNRVWEEDQQKGIEEATTTLKTKLDELKSALGRLGCVNVSDLEAVENELNGEVEIAEKALADFHASAPTFDSFPPEGEPTPAEPMRLTQLREKLQSIDRTLHGVEISIKGTNRQIDTESHELAHLDSKVGTPCGECGKHYEAGDLETARVARLRTIERLTNEVREHMDRRRKLLEAIALCNKRIDEMTVDHVIECERVSQRNEDAMQSYREALQAHRDAIAARDSTALRDALTEAKKKLAEFHVSSRKISELSVLTKTLANDIRRRRDETSPWKEVVKASLEALNEANAKRDDLQMVQGHAIAKVLSLEAIVQMFGPKGIRGELLDQVTPFLNARTSAYLSELSDGQISAVWETLGETIKGEVREKFHIKVDHKLGAEGFEGLSGGEKRKVRLAAAMALQDLVATRADRPIKLWIADEIDDALDVSGLERLMGLLEQKSREVGTVLIISHNDISDWVRNQVVVKKVSGVGVLEACNE